jgi:rubredoxin
MSQVETSQVETNAYQCPVCDYVYDEAKGEAREGFPPGTPWEQVPDDWCCPDCAVREKPDFEKFGKIS